MALLPNLPAAHACAIKTRRRGCGQTWGWYGAAIVAVATLWYFPLGTILSLAFLALLCFGVLRSGGGGAVTGL